MDYKQFMDSQQDLRSQLVEIMLAKKISMKEMAIEIGIAEVSLINFVKKNRPGRFRTLSHINDYIIKNKDNN